MGKFLDWVGWGGVFLVRPAVILPNSVILER